MVSSRGLSHSFPAAFSHTVKIFVVKLRTLGSSFALAVTTRHLRRLHNQGQRGQLANSIRGISRMNREAYLLMSYSHSTDKYKVAYSYGVLEQRRLMQ